MLQKLLENPWTGKQFLQVIATVTPRESKEKNAHHTHPVG